MKKSYFEDCDLGEKAVSLGRTVTEADIVSFAALSGDWNPVHCDADLMSRHELGKRIAHGLLVLSIGSGQLFRMVGYELLPEEGVIFSGIEQVRFVTPVKIGDTLTLVAEVTEKSELNERLGLLTMRIKMHNQQGELALSARFKCALPRRPVDASQVVGQHAEQGDA